MLKVYCHPRCTTCKRALKYLDEHNVEYEYIDLVSHTISKEDLRKYHELSGLEVKKFFNTSGKLYREMNLKDQVKTMSPEEAYEILSTSGLLIKRPLITDGENVTLGFKEEQFEQIWLK